MNGKDLEPKSLLDLPYDRGGLQFPNLFWYFWAVQIRACIFYFVKDHPPAWVTMGSQSVTVPINLYMYSADKRKLIKQTKKNFSKKNHYNGLVRSSHIFG